VVAAWLALYAIALEPHERRLVRDVAGGFLPRRRGSAQD